ncbi:LLM class flavin-dependent oxidoreductase [Sphaerisporangium perillae]|uniref:LLM class flavin-dependent oxidoreductase n=1 Tax=Sphaerisporangium perillae TaxID=2935860 RepID=UPI00200D1FE0|nr:LLM class flavin-dependent oxidoreductase [Sphaerisporangium perillae]
MVEWFLFLPQIRVPVADIVERARAAESAGFTGVAFMDHLLAPGAEQVPIWEAMTVASWVAARTDRLRIGHLVLCDAFRHPAVLAKQAVTLQEASGGRFELGLGSGSVPRELVRFGITGERAAQRRERLERSLEVLTQCWGMAGATEYVQAPQPATPIPLVLGGVSAPMLELVRKYANWWNLPAPEIGRLPELLPAVGGARVSVQQMVGFVGRGRSADEVYQQSTRRFGDHVGDGLRCGDADELAAYFTGLARGGVERFYVWFTDLAPPETLAEFGESVLPAVERALVPTGR